MLKPISNFIRSTSSGQEFQITKAKLLEIGNWKLEIPAKQAGFTLLELIVAIAILAVVSTFVITTLDPFEQYKKASDAKRKSDLAQIAKALEAYYQDNDSYPLTTGPDSECFYCMQTSEPEGQNVKEWGEVWTPYMQILPVDVGNRRYIYNSNGQSYWLYASLERSAYDPQVCNNGDSCLKVPQVSGSPVLCGAATEKCNYGISSTNESL